MLLGPNKTKVVISWPNQRLRRKKRSSSRSQKPTLSLQMSICDENMIDSFLERLAMMKRVLTLKIKISTSTGKIKSLRVAKKEWLNAKNFNKRSVTAWRIIATMMISWSSSRVTVRSMRPVLSCTAKRALKSLTVSMGHNTMLSKRWTIWMTPWTQSTIYIARATTKDIGIRTRTMPTILCPWGSEHGLPSRR